MSLYLTYLHCNSNMPIFVLSCAYILKRPCMCRCICVNVSVCVWVFEREREREREIERERERKRERDKESERERMLLKDTPQSAPVVSGTRPPADACV